MKTILSLCDYTGIWSNPYAEGGYRVLRFDIRNGSDIRLLQRLEEPVWGAIFQPPCTEFAASGARWWAGKGDRALLEGLSVVDACLRQVAIHPELAWWVLENPIGRLQRYLGKPVYTFNPADFAGLADNPMDEAYTKKTCLWGKFTPPLPVMVGELTSVNPVLGSKMHLLPQTPDRAEKRSITPQGFARAFFRANP